MKRVVCWTGLLGLFMGITVSCTAGGGMAGQVKTAPTVREAAAVKVSAGEAVYYQVCTLCHTRGLAGAPQLGDREAWNARVAQGMETLVERAINGYQGRGGMMPARGGNPSLSDDEVAAAVAFMVDKSK